MKKHVKNLKVTKQVLITPPLHFHNFLTPKAADNNGFLEAEQRKATPRSETGTGTSTDLGLGSLSGAEGGELL